MYHLTDVDGKGKGVNNVVVENISHKKYGDVLFDKKNKQTQHENSSN